MKYKYAYSALSFFLVALFSLLPTLLFAQNSPQKVYFTDWEAALYKAKYYDTEFYKAGPALRPKFETTPDGKTLIVTLWWKDPVEIYHLRLMYETLPSEGLLSWFKQEPTLLSFAMKREDEESWAKASWSNIFSKTENIPHDLPFLDWYEHYSPHRPFLKSDEPEPFEFFADVSNDGEKIEIEFEPKLYSDPSRPSTPPTIIFYASVGTDGNVELNIHFATGAQLCGPCKKIKIPKIPEELKELKRYTQIKG